MASVAAQPFSQGLATQSGNAVFAFFSAMHWRARRWPSARSIDSEARHHRPVRERATAADAGDVERERCSTRAGYGADKLVGRVSAAANLQRLAGIDNRGRWSCPAR
jgi:hypothetical protein